jgi:HEPN domain-containing protein
LKQPRDLARRYLALAQRDARTLAVRVDSPGVDDEPIGFHAQQAVEKCLKAILALHGVAFRKTHDLDELLGLLEERRLPLPPQADSLDELNPYGVLLRYELGEAGALDRADAQQSVATVLGWAAELIG